MTTDAGFALRPANDADSAALAGLCSELGYAAEEADIRSRLAGVDGASRAVTVACAGSRVVGWIEVRVAGALESGEWVEITGLIVSADARRLGIGGRLMRWAESWARERGQARLRVRSNVRRAEAKAFYPQQGFTETKTQRVFERNLDPV